MSKKGNDVLSSVEIGEIPTMRSGKVVFQFGVRENGERFIDLRHVSDSADGTRYWSHKGVTMSIDHISEIARLFNDIEAIVKEEQDG